MKSSYHLHLTSFGWRARKWLASLAMQPFIGKRCIMCNAPRRDWHHRHYANVGNEWPLRDIVPVCRDCHRKFHNK